MSINGTGYAVVKYRDALDVLQTVNFPESPTEYNYYIPDTIIKKSVITGIRKKVIKGYYHQFKVNLVNVDSTLMNHLKAMRNSEHIEVYPHSSSTTYFLCILEEFEPYYYKSYQFLDACKVSFITESYVS